MSLLACLPNQPSFATQAFVNLLECIGAVDFEAVMSSFTFWRLYEADSDAGFLEEQYGDDRRNTLVNIFAVSSQVWELARSAQCNPDFAHTCLFTSIPAHSSLDVPVHTRDEFQRNFHVFTRGCFDNIDD
jgi:hypothetical protein